MKQIRGQWSVPVLNGLIGLFRTYHDVNVFAIPGNHDGVGDDRSGLDVLSELPNVHVFGEPTIHHAPWGDGKVAYWPWRPTLDGLPGFLDAARREKARVLVAHAFLSGAAVGPDAVTLKSEATLEQFGLAGTGRVFDFAFLGDIHKAQYHDPNQSLGRWMDGAPASPIKFRPKRDEKQTNSAWCFYPGSLYAQNWGEREDGKGALFVDLDAGTVEPVPVKAPRFRVVDATALTATTLEGLLYRGHSIEFAGDWTGDFVRLLVGPRANGAVLERIREASGARAFQVVIQREARTERRVEISAAMSHGEMLENYVKARPPEDGLSAKAVLDAGRRLLG